MLVVLGPFEKLIPLLSWLMFSWKVVLDERLRVRAHVNWYSHERCFKLLIHQLLARFDDLTAKLTTLYRNKLTGSTISTLLHDRINPKDCQVLSLGDTGFLQFFRVVSRDYGKPRLTATKMAQRIFVGFGVDPNYTQINYLAKSVERGLGFFLRNDSGWSIGSTKPKKIGKRRNMEQQNHQNDRMYKVTIGCFEGFLFDWGNVEFVLCSSIRVCSCSSLSIYI